MARRPRVFSWSDGFHRYVVSTTSRAKALEAWGFDRDLFREGAANEITEGAAHDAALAKPGEVIEEAAGEIRELAKAAPPKPKAKTGPSRALAAARRRLQAAEAKLEALDETAAAAEADLAQREAALAEERAALESDHSKRRGALRDQVEAARRAVKDAG